MVTYGIQFNLSTQSYTVIVDGRRDSSARTFGTCDEALAYVDGMERADRQRLQDRT